MTINWPELRQISIDDLTMVKLSALQNAYKSASISYRLQGVTRSVNDTWARNGNDLEMKDKLRKGGYSTLNVYFQTDLQASHGGNGRLVPYDLDRQNDLSPGLTSLVLGFCTMPDPKINANSPRHDYVKDGCNVLARTMPGGPLTGYNHGGTAIHEVGHWNGLLHTFQGESCSPDNDGDYITDTPQEAVPTQGCPSEKNSCPSCPGVDAIHNFMDYSSDECYESFTPGQIRRMRSMWSATREGK